MLLGHSLTQKTMHHSSRITDHAPLTIHITTHLRTTPPTHYSHNHLLSSCVLSSPLRSSPNVCICVCVCVCVCLCVSVCVYVCVCAHLNTHVPQIDIRSPHLNAYGPQLDLRSPKLDGPISTSVASTSTRVALIPKAINQNEFKSCVCVCV